MSASPVPAVFAVIVTYNRKELLLRCLQAMRAQARRPDRVIVVDNASTDGTPQALHDAGWLDQVDVELLQLTDNTGGAGGFAAGMARALDLGAQWVWVMDDDALPQPEALAALCAVGLDPESVYGSVAIDGGALSWPMERQDTPKRERIETLAQAPALCEVRFIPFLGLMASRQLTERIGLPDPSFFLAVDDVEFCLRARRAGARIRLVSSSRIEHPRAQLTCVRFGWRRFYNLRLVPWKRYYDVRNRLVVARRHYGAALWYSTLPGTLLRLLITLATEPERAGQWRAFVGGVVDGLLDRRGRRHERWLAGVGTAVRNR